MTFQWIDELDHYSVEFAVEYPKHPVSSVKLRFYFGHSINYSLNRIVESKIDYWLHQTWVSWRILAHRTSQSAERSGDDDALQQQQLELNRKLERNRERWSQDYVAKADNEAQQFQEEGSEPSLHDALQER